MYFQIYCKISQPAWSVTSVFKVHILPCPWAVQVLTEDQERHLGVKGRVIHAGSKSPLPFRK